MGMGTNIQEHDSVHITSAYNAMKTDATAHSRCLRRICAARLGPFVAFNGPGRISCTGMRGICGCMHAEARLLAQLLADQDKYYRVLETCDIMLTTLSPCVACAHMVGESRLVVKWLYLRQYRETRGIQVARTYGIEIRSATSVD